MELRINCNESINLDQFASVNSIGIEVMSYKADKDTLNGDIKINGEYQKKVKDGVSTRGFEEIVPFTVVFRTDNFKIVKIYIENFSFQEEPNKGVNCKFEVVIVYTQEENAKPNDNVEDIEIPVEINQIVAVGGKDEFVEPETMEDPLIEEYPGTYEIEEENAFDEEASKITKEYDDLLKDILLERKDNFLDSNVKIIPARNSEKVNFRNISENYKTIKVYYGIKDSDIEGIAKKEKLPIESIYKNNRDYQNTRRIIIQ